MRRTLTLTHCMTVLSHITSLSNQDCCRGQVSAGQTYWTLRRQQKKFSLQLPTTFSSSVHIFLHLPRPSLHGSQAANSPTWRKSCSRPFPRPWRWRKGPRPQKERVCIYDDKGSFQKPLEIFQRALLFSKWSWTGQYSSK